MRRLLLASAVLIALLASAHSMTAQSDYLGAVGLRLGPAYGITGKYFVTPSWALEGHFSGRRRGFEMTALAEKHRVPRRLANLLAQFRVLDHDEPPILNIERRR